MSISHQYIIHKDGSCKKYSNSFFDWIHKGSSLHYNHHRHRHQDPICLLVEYWGLQVLSECACFSLRLPREPGTSSFMPCLEWDWAGCPLLYDLSEVAKPQVPIPFGGLGRIWDMNVAFCLPIKCISEAATHHCITISVCIKGEETVFINLFDPGSSLYWDMSKNKTMKVYASWKSDDSVMWI